MRKVSCLLEVRRMTTGRREVNVCRREQGGQIECDNNVQNLELAA